MVFAKPSNGLKPAAKAARPVRSAVNHGAVLSSSRRSQPSGALNLAGKTAAGRSSIFRSMQRISPGPHHYRHSRRLRPLRSLARVVTYFGGVVIAERLMWLVQPVAEAWQRAGGDRKPARQNSQFVRFDGRPADSGPSEIVIVGEPVVPSSSSTIVADFRHLWMGGYQVASSISRRARSESAPAPICIFLGLLRVVTARDTRGADVVAAGFMPGSCRHECRRRRRADASATPVIGSSQNCPASLPCSVW